MSTSLSFRTSGIGPLVSLSWETCEGCCKLGLLAAHRCFVQLVIFYVGGYESDYCYQNVYVKSFLSHIFASYTTCLTIKTFSTRLMIILSFPTLCSNITWLHGRLQYITLTGFFMHLVMSEHHHCYYFKLSEFVAWSGVKNSERQFLRNKNALQMFLGFLSPLKKTYFKRLHGTSNIFLSRVVLDQDLLV